MKTNLNFLLALLAAGTLGAPAEETAIVKDKRVNVRGQATLNSEVVTQLKKDEKVTVLEEIPVAKPKKGEPASWLRIALPANTPVWVNSQFITNQTITVKKLNVRAGPGENFSVVARLEQGAKVKEIRTVENWMEIEAPAGASAYIASDLVIRERPATGGTLATTTATASPAPTAPVPAATVETVKPEPAPVPAASELKPPPKPPEPATSLVVEKAAAPAPEPATTTAEPMKVAAAKPAEEEPKRSWFGRMFNRSTNKTETARAEKPAPKPAAKPEPAKVEVEALPPRLVTREGVVRRNLNIQAPSDYVLENAESGQVINYLYTTSTNLPWKAIKGRTVIVTGEEALDPRWPKTPVLTIETLNTVP